MSFAIAVRHTFRILLRSESDSIRQEPAQNHLPSDLQWQSRQIGYLVTTKTKLAWRTRFSRLWVYCVEQFTVWTSAHRFCWKFRRKLKCHILFQLTF